MLYRIPGSFCLCLFFVICLSAATAFADLPPLFEGGLDVCNGVEQERAKGKSLEEALRAFILKHEADDPMVLNSIRRTIIHHAIKTCRFDAAVVIGAAYQAGLPLDLVAGAAMGAGINEAMITQSLIAAGVDPDTAKSVFELAKVLPEPPASDFLPPPFQVGGGLGQASPFLP